MQVVAGTARIPGSGNGVTANGGQPPGAAALVGDGRVDGGIVATTAGVQTSPIWGIERGILLSMDAPGVTNCDVILVRASLCRLPVGIAKNADGSEVQIDHRSRQPVAFCLVASLPREIAVMKLLPFSAVCLLFAGAFLHTGVRGQDLNFRTIRTEVHTIPFDFTYTMRGNSQMVLSTPVFDNTLFTLEGIDLGWNFVTDMHWQQTLFRQVPVGTRFAEGAGSMSIGVSPALVTSGSIELGRSVALDCIPNSYGVCFAHTANNSYSFSENASRTFRQLFESSSLGGDLFLSASNAKLPGTLGDYTGSYRTHGSLSLSYIYDDTTPAEFAREAYRRALATYLPTLGAGQPFDQVAFSKLVYAKAIAIREEFSTVNGQRTTLNQNAKGVEYVTRGINGALIQRAGLSASSDINDVANAFITLSAPTYVALKMVGQSLGVDYSEQGGGKASIARPQDAIFGIQGFLAGSDGGTVEAALNSIYGLDLQPHPGIPRPEQPPPTKRQEGTEVPLRLNDNGPRMSTQLFAVNVTDLSSPILIDPPNNGRTLFVLSGSFFSTVKLLTPEGVDLAFHLETRDRHFDVMAGQTFDFGMHSLGEDLDWFFVSGIDASVPEFDALFTFTKTGAISLASIDVSAVPEPATYAMLFAGLFLVLGASARRRRAIDACAC